jgi:hypothetical protein
VATPAQLKFIQSLVGERQEALQQDEYKHVLSMGLDTSRQASDLISALKRVPRDPQPVNDEEAAIIDTLAAKLDDLSPRDRSFAASLVNQFRERGRLSDKQWPHAKRFATEDTQETVRLEKGDIVAKDDELYMIVQSRTSGRLYAKRLVGQNWAYDPSGISKARTGEVLTPEEAAKRVCLKKYGALPGTEELRQLAVAFAHKTSTCMFCCRELTDERSDPKQGGMGYGPVCADNYGLPWG